MEPGSSSPPPFPGHSPGPAVEEKCIGTATTQRHGFAWLRRGRNERGRECLRRAGRRRPMTNQSRIGPSPANRPLAARPRWHRACPDAQGQHYSRSVEVPVTARELMTLKPATLTTQATIAEAWDLMRELEIRHVPVTQDGALVGMLSDRDLAQVDIARVLMGQGAAA